MMFAMLVLATIVSSKIETYVMSTKETSSAVLLIYAKKAKIRYS